jgi:hypothetical protein
VRSVSAGSNFPIFGGAGRGTFVSVDGYQPAPDEEMRIDWVVVAPRYFETLGIPFLDGRDFGPEAADGGAPTAIVNREMAERYWADGNAVGGQFSGPSFPVPVRVVGVVDDVHWDAIEEEATNYVFLPMTPSSPEVASIMSLVVRTDGDAAGLVPELAEAARGLEPDLAVDGAASMDDAIGALLMPQRVGTVLLSGFGALALILAAVGIGGVVSYTVGERRRSIGVRIALGARRGQVVWMIVLGMVPPVALGLLAGLATATLLGGAVEGFLYGIAPGDPTTYVLTSLGLGVVALLAALLPAGAATRVDPLKVLRAE